MGFDVDNWFWVSIKFCKFGSLLMFVDLEYIVYI